MTYRFIDKQGHETWLQLPHPPPPTWVVPIIPEITQPFWTPDYEIPPLIQHRVFQRENVNGELLYVEDVEKVQMDRGFVPGA